MIQLPTQWTSPPSNLSWCARITSAGEISWCVDFNIDCDTRYGFCLSWTQSSVSTLSPSSCDIVIRNVVCKLEGPIKYTFSNGNSLTLVGWFCGSCWKSIWTTQEVFELVCLNALLYNRKGSRIHKSAQQLLRNGRRFLQACSYISSEDSYWCILTVESSNE